MTSPSCPSRSGSARRSPRRTPRHPATGRAAADEEPQPPTGQALAQRPEDEPVGEPCSAERTGPQGAGVNTACPRQWPSVNTAWRDRAGLAEAGHDDRIHLFVHARHAAHDGRLNLAELLGEVVGAARDPGLAAVDEADEDVIDPLENVGVRKEGERRVGLRDRVDLHRGAADVDQIPMCELDALRVAGRARCVHDGAEVVGLDLLQPGEDLPGLRRAPATQRLTTGSISAIVLSAPSTLSLPSVPAPETIATTASASAAIFCATSAVELG